MKIEPRISLFLPDPAFAGGAFTLEADASDADTLNLLLSPPGSRAEPTVLWSRAFDVPDDRIAVLDATFKTDLDVTFLGHLTMNFGAAALDEFVDRIVCEARDRRLEAAAQAARLARDHKTVDLYAPDKKNGHMLELRRASLNIADWSVTYDRASERDRLLDWLRWQKPRFLDFLGYAEEHGKEALTQLLTDEMFSTERRVKREGRGAGGSRPLRMWRGD